MDKNVQVIEKCNQIIHLVEEYGWLIIVAGGQGTRLFPISHPRCPKQFCKFDDKDTFIQSVIDRFKSIGVKPTRIIVAVTNDCQEALAREQCIPRGVLSQNILRVNPNLGYAGSMVEASKFVYELDPKAIVINTPSDQYIAAGAEFTRTIKDAFESAKRGPVIVGVKTGDIVTVMGCGHAIYNEKGGPCYPVVDFVEKPDRETADKIMRKGNSACNTGINIWTAKLINQLFSTDSEYVGISTDDLMAKLGNLKVAVGNFEWHDCGTLKSLYEISGKTPNHKNASIGGGVFERVDCRRSLLYAGEGMELHVSGSEDDAIVFTVINEKPVVVVAKHSHCQNIKLLAEDYFKYEEILAADFSMGARNNTVLHSNISGELVVGFVGVENYAVYVERKNNGDLVAIVSQQLRPQKS